jgi:serine/threonine protein kinase
MSFHPAANDSLLIDHIGYRIAEHPSAPGLPYGQEGRAGTVYQLLFSKGAKALKVIKPRFSTPSLVQQADTVAQFSMLPGLQVCQLSVLSPSRDGSLLRRYPDLTYAMLMPWIEGQTWFDVINSRKTFTPKESLALAQRFSNILVSLEKHDLAHCDLSSSNLILSMNRKDISIELVDIDGMYGPNFPKPAIILSGSPGYAHNSIQNGSWSSESDRFAGAVILAEMLGWSSPEVRKAANDGCYFTTEDMQKDCPRYQRLVGYLRDNFGEAVMDCFSTAWHSTTLNDCPTFGKWLVSLPGEVIVRSSLADTQPLKTVTDPLSRLAGDALAAVKIPSPVSGGKMNYKVIDLSDNPEPPPIKAKKSRKPSQIKDSHKQATLLWTGSILGVLGITFVLLPGPADQKVVGIIMLITGLVILLIGANS